MSDDTLEVVYPASRRAVMKGRLENGYIHFHLPTVHEHVILVMKRSERQP
jgi:hypothetical protein